MDQPVTIIQPSHGWQLINFRELWQHRELMYFLAWRDVKTRYKQTVLGGAWAVLQPLATMAIFTVFLGRVAAAHPSEGPAPYPPYWLFVLAGMLPWSFFANIVGRASQSVLGGSGLITKVYFPRLIVPVASAGAPLVDLAITFGILLILLLGYGAWPGWGLLLVPFLVLGLVIASMGVGILLSALTVAYRDFGSITPFLIQLWLFATPAIYIQDDALFGPRWRALLPLNPAQGLITNFRQAVLGGDLDLYSLAVSGVVSLLLAFLGCFYFRRVEQTFADVI